jgi:Cdc6-like AAA superfamily ATPase
VVDPKLPGAVDEIIHLGDYWDENGLRARRKEIREANEQVGRCFARAYRFLRAAQAVYDDWETLNRQAMDYARANQKAAALLDQILAARPVSSRLGRDRHLFASAITPDGLMNYVDTIIGPMPRKYVIQGEPGTGKSYLLKKIATAALERGLDVELYHCPLNPEKVEHVVIPALGVALTKSIEPHTWRPAPEDIIVDMNECLNAKTVANNRAAMTDCERLFGQLFSQAISCIHDAKATHDLMEAYYIPCMDFEKITEVRERTLQRILGYAAELGMAAE